VVNKELVEQIAEVIFQHAGGMYPHEYENIMGEKKKLWKTDAPWDTNPNELAEHERDEYRVQAQAVLKFLGIG
jgi:hypothetical protein